MLRGSGESAGGAKNVRPPPRSLETAIRNAVFFGPHLRGPWQKRRSLAFVRSWLCRTNLLTSVCESRRSTRRAAQRATLSRFDAPYEFPVGSDLRFSAPRTDERRGKHHAFAGNHLIIHAPGERRNFDFDTCS